MSTSNMLLWINKNNINNFWSSFLVEVLRPNEPLGVISCMVSLPNHTFTGQA